MITGEMQANTVVGAGDSYMVRRHFEDDHGPLVPGDVVSPERASTWGDSHIRALKSACFITPHQSEEKAWRVVRAFKDHEGTLAPGYDIPPERMSAWPERSRILFERMGMIEPRTMSTAEPAQRKRGRPRKDAAADVQPVVTIKRKRGRPRKNQEI